MEVSWTDPVKRREALKLETHYIRELGVLMRRSSERLLVILSVHMRVLLQAYENEYNQTQKAGIRVAMREFSESVSAALDYTKIDLVSFGSSGANGNNVALQIGKCLRDDVKKVPK